MNDAVLNKCVEVVDKIASVCHTVNKAFCNSNGDFTHAAWSECSDDLKRSTYNGVIHIIKNPTTTPEEIFLNWKKEKVRAGWVHGVVKDETKLTHPNLNKTFEQLSLHERTKDTLFVETVKSLFFLLDDLQ